MVFSSALKSLRIAASALNTSLPEYAQPITTESQGSDPLHTATGVYVVVHGHFYQPPRENPYLDAIERQPSAAPFHDWNERIHYECYRPNAFARILNDRGEVVGIVNNYEYFSFNIGPTLMSWLECHDREVYERILEADRKSCQRLKGHGNAIAQVYNHIILPLANERDKYTQIRWGKGEFRSRFGRDPEGMWLAETAVDYATLEALVAEGIRFIILAPSQAQRCRPFPDHENPAPEWHEVGGSQIDPTRPYRCYLKGEAEIGQDTPPSPHTPYIDIFFYDGPISRDMGFNDVLQSSLHFAGRLGQAVRGDHRPTQLLAVATDGETFGHHKAGAEKCAAYTFVEEFPQRGWTVTNFAHYLSISPPTWEVELKPVTAWSCAHGVDRWQEDCGCGGGGEWHQQWRRPLRDSLDWLRDQLNPIYEEEGGRFFRDPWATRDDYIQVIRDRSVENVNQFLAQHQTHPLNLEEQMDALRLLEMQRHALLMYTSCGWFFEEISRPEGTQILRYAARALELAGEVVGVQLEPEFIGRLASAPSNVDVFKTGDEVYRQLVITAKISLEQVAAHYAISSLFTTYQTQEQIYCYQAQQLDYQIQRMGALTLAVGQVQLLSEITRETRHFVFAVLHLGGWDFHCCIQPFVSRLSYTQLKKRLFDALQEASAASAILGMVQFFGEQSFSLRNLFAEERHRIMRLLSQETLTRLDQLYTQVYRDNYGVIAAFHRDELPVPRELQVAAEVALGHRCWTTVRALQTESNEGQIGINRVLELEAIAAEAHHLRCQINIIEVKTTLEQVIERLLQRLLSDDHAATLETDIALLDRLIKLGNLMNLGVSLDRGQELYYQYLYGQIVPVYLGWLQRQAASPELWVESGGLPEIGITTAQRYRQLLQLGQTLGVDVDLWLRQLP